MKQRDLLRGCADFIEGKATIEASLPVNNPYCKYCRWCKFDYGLDKAICLINKKDLPDYKKSIGAECPVEWQLTDEDIIF